MELRLKALLRERNLTQAEVADRMGVSRAQLNRLIKGGRHWKKRDLQAFSIAIGVKIAELRAIIDNTPSMPGDAHPRTPADGSLAGEPTPSGVIQPEASPQASPATLLR